MPTRTTPHLIPMAPCISTYLTLLNTHIFPVRTTLQFEVARHLLPNFTVRSQVAKDTAHPTQHTGRAHQ